MTAQFQKVLADFIIQRVDKGESIETALMHFYKNVRFAASADEAQQILKKGGTKLFDNKVIDLKINDKMVTVVSYSLINQEYVYVINIEEFKNNPMKLNDYYKQLRDQPAPQREFREKIAAACGVSEMTVYRWLSGEIVPEKLKREKIAEITGLPVEELFPTPPTDGPDKL